MVRTCGEEMLDIYQDGGDGAVRQEEKAKEVAGYGEGCRHAGSWRDTDA